MQHHQTAVCQECQSCMIRGEMATMMILHLLRLQLLQLLLHLLHHSLRLYHLASHLQLDRLHHQTLHHLHNLLRHQHNSLLVHQRIHLLGHLLHQLLAPSLHLRTSKHKTQVSGPIQLSLASSSPHVPLAPKAPSMSVPLNARTSFLSVSTFALCPLLLLLLLLRLLSLNAPRHQIHSLRLQLMHQLLMALIERSPTVHALPHRVPHPQTTNWTS